MKGEPNIKIPGKTVIGVCGLIGSGKSVVMRLLEMKGCPTFDCDRVAKEAYFDSHMREAFIDLLGEDPVNRITGKLKKELLQSALATDHKEELERLTHRYVLQRLQMFASESSSRLVAVESAILFSSGFFRLCDHILLVDAPLEVRKQRVLARDKDAPNPEARFAHIVALQKHEEEAMQAHHEKIHLVVINDDQHALIPQVEQLLQSPLL